FAPEHFARVILADPMKRKQLDAGLRQLTEEGAAQVFFTSGTETSGPTPIVGAVGMLQFDVMLHRLEHEYGAPCRLEKIAARYPRWVCGAMCWTQACFREDLLDLDQHLFRRFVRLSKLGHQSSRGGLELLLRSHANGGRVDRSAHTVHGVASSLVMMRVRFPSAVS